MTYPVPPVAGVVALTLRHEVIHHGGTSLSASAQGSMLKSWTVSSRVRHDLHVAKAALKNRPLRLLGLVVGRVVLYTPVASPSGLVVAWSSEWCCPGWHEEVQDRGARGGGAKVGGDGGEGPRKCGSASAAQVFGVKRHQHANMPAGPRPKQCRCSRVQGSGLSSRGYSRAKQGYRAGFSDFQGW